MIYYSEIVGSRLYNLNLKNSDIDNFQISEQSQRLDTIHDKINHQICWNVEEGLNLLLSNYQYYHFELSVGYGEKLLYNELTKYVENNRECFKYENIGNAFQSFITYELSMKKNLYGERLYNNLPKLEMYFILYKYIFTKYYQNKNLEECIHLPEEIRQFLLSVRTHELPYQEVLNFELSLRRQMDKVKSFYADRFNIKYAAREKEKMKQIIQNLKN